LLLDLFKKPKFNGMEIPSRVILGDYKEKELLKDAYSFCYQETDKLSLNLHLFAPQGHTPESQTPIVVFFHGGLWDTSMPTQLASQAIHFSQRGLVSCLVEYRVSNVHGTDMTAAQEDVSEAMNYLRLNASGFGLNPEQFILCGAAGGGMLVLNEVLTNESTANSCKGIHLLGPISDLSTREHLEQFSLDKKSAKELSPLKLLPKKELPDCLILHGKSDRLVNSDQSIRRCRSPLL